jgi:hypothetical protein
MSILIKNLCNKLLRIETRGIPPNKPPNEDRQRNTNPFRRPFNPQMLRREKK